MKQVKPENLEAFCLDILKKHGVESQCAQTVAHCLVDADLCGISTHGVSRLAIYLERLDAGVVSKENRITIERESPAALVVNAGNSLGMPAAKFTMEKCIEKAREAGCCFATVKNSNHFGAAAYYTRLAAEQGMVGICAANLTSKIAPYGASEPYMGTNPISIASPGEEGAVVLDMAPSVVALGKLIMAQKLGKPIPEGWALDKDGHPTTDPAEGRKGSLLPIGGPKGSGLAIMIDILCGVLSGGKFGPHLHDLYGDMQNSQEVGHFIGAIDISHFVEVDTFRSGVAQMRREIKSLRPAEGVSEIFMPGEGSDNRCKKNLEQGISLPDEIFGELLAIGKACGAVFPEE